MRWLPVGADVWFDFDGVRSLYIIEDDGHYDVYARMDDVDAPMSVMGYETHEQAERGIWALTRLLQTGKLPAPKEFDEARARAEKFIDEESES